MQAILNIGLKSEQLGDIHPEVVSSLIRAHFGEPINSIVIHSDSEPTMVATVEQPGAMAIGQIVRRLSHVLGQDCIAVWLPGLSQGRLIGPNAAKWGDFNSDFFLMPDGTRLSGHELPIAA